MSNKMNQDIKALRAAIKAINQSSDKRMLRANMNFLWDYYIAHPSKELPKHLKG